MTKRVKRKLFITLFLCAVLLSFFAVLQAVKMYSLHQQELEYSKLWAKDKTAEIAEDLSKRIQYVASVANALAQNLSSQYCNSCDIEKILKQHYLRNDEFINLGVAFKPLESGTKFRLYAPFIKSNAAMVVDRLDRYYDYSATFSGEDYLLHRNPEFWFSYAMERSGEWLPPFYEVSLDAYVIRYAAPIFDENKQKIGLAFVDVSLEWLGETVERYDLRDNNYLSLMSKEGDELYHSLKGPTQIVTALGGEQVGGVLQNETHNTLTGKPAWANRLQVEGTGWWLQTSIAAHSVLPGFSKNNTLWHSAIPVVISQANPVAWVSLLVLISTLGYSCLRLRRKRTTLKLLWWDSAVYTLFFSLGVVAVWFFEYGSVSDKQASGVVVANKAIIEKYKKDHALTSLKSFEQAPIYIPVGLFIQSIEFLSASNVSVTGYIWHRYKDGQVSDYKKGTIFPEAISTNMNLAYEEEMGGEIIKGWYFETTLRENFSPDRFPLDRQSVWIRLWHENFGGNTVLVPDIKSYDSLNTRSLPGIEKDFVLSGWTLYRSYFEMRNNVYNTRFAGLKGSAGGAIPELYFNIEVTRNFINPFLAHLFPLLVVVLMLYAIVITMSTDQERKDFLGFNASGVVASCSALFFVALIAHVQMRNELAANSVVYLEYFYLITYVFILMITANAVLLSLNAKLWFVQYHDNLLPKLIYWPALTSGLFLCTLWCFR